MTSSLLPQRCLSAVDIRSRPLGALLCSLQLYTETGTHPRVTCALGSSCLKPLGYLKFVLTLAWASRNLQMQFDWSMWFGLMMCCAAFGASRLLKVLSVTCKTASHVQVESAYASSTGNGLSMMCNQVAPTLCCQVQQMSALHQSWRMCLIHCNAARLAGWRQNLRRAIGIASCSC